MEYCDDIKALMKVWEVVPNAGQSTITSPIVFSLLQKHVSPIVKIATRKERAMTTRRAFLKRAGFSTASLIIAERIMARPYDPLPQFVTSYNPVRVRGAVKAIGKGIPQVVVFLHIPSYSLLFERLGENRPSNSLIVTNRELMSLSPTYGPLTIGGKLCGMKTG